MRATPSFRPWVVLAVATLGALSSVAVRPRVVELAPGEPGFRRLVGGATPSGRIHARAIVTLPGLPRAAAGELRLELAEPGAARLRFEGGAVSTARTDRSGVLVAAIPPAETPGARVLLSPLAGEPPLALTRLRVTAHPRVGWPAVSSFALIALAGLAAFGAGRRRLATPLALAAAGLLVLSWSPALLWLTLPDPAALAQLFVPALALGASALLGRRVPSYGSGVALVVAAVLGLWVRLYFLPSAGSWDTEYWKAWTARAVEAGVTRVYGDDGAVPDGGLLDQMRGREPTWRTEYKGRDFVVDYPPLAMASLRWSRAAVDRFSGLGLAERENVAVKLPAVLGDVLAVVLLLVAFRDRPGRAATLAALYWALPVSWLSSAVLGFLDGAYAPFAVAGLLAAGAGRAGWAGALLATGALLKPQAGIFLPAAAVALVAGGARLTRAVGSGLAVVAVVLVPFALAGTLDEAVAHVFRVLFQERLSAGFANPWWGIGHLASGGGFAERVEFTRIDQVSFPAGLVGTALFALAVAWFCLRLPRAAALVGALSIFAYAMLAMGVHENHPHAMFLALAASGLAMRKSAVLAAVGASTYVLNMLALSGLGRFYGLRYLAVEPLAADLAALRMALGFDLTLLLAVVNTALFVWALAGDSLYDARQTLKGNSE